MITTETILQCEVCCRQHDGHLEVLPTRAGIPQFAPCGLDDCKEIVRQDEEREERQRLARRQKAKGKRQNQSGNGTRGATRTSCKTPATAPVEARQPWKESPDDTRRPVESAKCEVRSAKSDNGPTGTVTAGSFGQRDYEASGAGAGANGLLIAFFELPENLNKWFAATWLLDVVAKDKSRHMNNRAVDLRKHFLPSGLYLDNQMEQPPGFEGKVSCYRLCAIPVAVSLDEQAKRRLMVTAGLLPEEQPELLDEGKRQK